jgi:GTP cyclohydrolase FolE2
METLPDVQSQKDLRGRAIQKVGVSDIRLPLSFRSVGKLDASVQHTVGEWKS